MENLYASNYENCNGNCRECEASPTVMEYRSLANECLPVTSLIETLEMFLDKEVYINGNPGIRLNIGEDFVNITSIERKIPQGQFLF